jgi:spermidine synthase
VKRRAPIASTRAVVASSCLLLSGAAALTYQVCWIRQGSLVFGSSTLATSTLLALFFGGLSVGSYLFGRLAPRVASSLRLFAMLEIAIGVLGAASIALIDLADPLYGEVQRAFRDSPALLALLRAAVVAGVILPPTILMGASLPLLCSLVPDGPRRLTGSVALLYAANTLGAAVGCLAAGLLLIPRLGLQGTVLAGALANFAAAGLALALGGPAERVVARASPRGVPSRVVVSLGALFFLAGFSGLAYEVLWTRFLALVVRNTVYTYTLSVGVVLIGIVIGSLLAPALARGAAASGRVFGALQVFAALYVLTILLLPPAVWQYLGTDVLACLAMFLPPAISSGASFPLAIRAVAASGGALAGHVGRMSALNTLGGIAGSVAAGFVGLPRLGLQTSALVATALSVATGIGAWLLFASGRPRVRDLAFPALAGGAWLALPLLLETRVPADYLADGGVLVDHREGLTSNVAVIRSNGLLQLRIDHWWQGEERKTHQIVGPHLVMLLHPDPRAVLVVGAGTGQAARRFLDYPIDRLDVVDIEPAVFDLVEEHFDDAWVKDPRVERIRDDGRNVVAHTDRRYDVIALEVGQVFRPGVASFYTADFYRRARARLREGGLLSQFVPLAFLTPEELRRIVATFREVFPESVLWYNTSELLLIGARGAAVRLSEPRLALLESAAHIHADLQYSHWGDRGRALNRPEVLLGGFLSGAPGLAALSEGAAPYRDDRPTLEYETSRTDRSRTAEMAIVPLLRGHLDAPALVLDGPLDAGREARVLEQRERNLRDLIASALVRRADEVAGAGDATAALALLDEALRENPESVPALRLAANLLVGAGRVAEARRRYEEVLRLEPDDALALRGLGRCNLVEGRTEEALEYYRRTLALRPNDAQTRNNLGAILASRQDLQGALVHFREAARLEPRDPATRENLERLEAMLDG